MLLAVLRIAVCQPKLDRPLRPFAPSPQVIPLDTGVPTQQRYPSSYSP